MALAFAPFLHAADFVVTTYPDTSSATLLTLRDAIADAATNPGPDTIRFDPSLDGATILLSGSQLIVESDVVIDASDLPGGITLDAGLDSRVFLFRAAISSPAPIVTLRHLTIQGGNTPGGSNRNGGGIYNDAGNITLEDCSVVNNRTGTGTSSGGHGAGILNLNGILNLTRCRISTNLCGSGPAGGPGGRGGGISTAGGQLVMTDCTVQGNQAGQGGNNSHGGQGGGIYSTGSTCSFMRCTFSNNTSGSGTINGNGGSGGGLILFAGLHDFENCTISGNTCGSGIGTGYGGNGGGIFNDTSLLMIHCTLTGNQTGRNGSGPTSFGNGQGLYNANGVFTNLSASIIAGNLPGSFYGSDMWGGNVPPGENLIGGDAMLGPLGDYGGLTQTHYLRPGSLAVDATTSLLATDQRGTARQGPADIGAYELVTGGNLVVTTRIDENGTEEISTGLSLREALSDGEPFSTIEFDPTIFTATTHTILLDHGALMVDRPFDIDASTTPAGVTIDAGSASRVVQVNDRITDTSMHALVLTGGNTSTNGGAIHVGSGAQLELSDMNISGNSSTASHGGGIHNEGHLTLTRSTITDNFAEFLGGGIHHAGDGSLIMNDCTLAGNSAQIGGGIAIWSLSASVLSNSTISENAAHTGGGISNNGSTTTLSQCTVSGNSAEIYGGIQRTGDGEEFSQEALNIHASIVAGNSPNMPDINSWSSSTSSLISGDPQLAPLGDYGGPTWTMPPLPGSPAIDTGDIALTPFFDQRGIQRDCDGDGDGFAQMDAGAVEYDPATDLALFWPMDWDGDGTSYGVEQALGTDPSVADPADPANLRFVGITPGVESGIRFGINPAADDRTDWIVRRSPDMESWVEVYRRAGADGEESFATGFSASADPGDPGLLILTDTSPPAPTGFYQLDAVIGPR